MKKLVLFSCFVSAAVAVASGVGNLLPFSTDFETGVDGWQGATVYAKPPQRVLGGRYGSYCMKQEGETTLRSAFVWDVIESNEWYTLSFDFRGDGGRVRASVVDERWQWYGAREMSAKEGWQRFTCTFRTREKRKSRTFYLRLEYKGGQQAFYDGFWFGKGRKPAAYAPPAVQFSCALGEPGEIHFEEDGVPALTVRAAVRPDAVKQPLRVRVTGPEWSVDKSIELSVGADMRIPLPECSRSGYYPLMTELTDASGKVIANRETAFVVTRRAEGNQFFGISASTGADVTALRRVGFEWIRGNTKFWYHVERTGPVAYTGNEPVVKRRPDAFRFLGKTCGIAPDWAREKGRTYWCDDPKKAIPFMRHLVRTTREEIDQYEIINEPDLNLPKEKGVTFQEAISHYCDILEAVSPVIHEAGKPVVMNVSGVREGTDFIEGVLKRTPESVDIISLHPYSWPRELADDNRVVSDPETGGFLDDLNRKFAMLSKYPKKRTVIGELGWALSMESKLSGHAATKLGWYLARMYLLARSYSDIEYLIWFSLGNTPEHGKNDYCMWRVTNDDVPRPTSAVAAACEAARRLPQPGDGSVSRVSEDGIYLLRWSKDGRTHFAFWTDETGFVRDIGRLGIEGAGRARSVFGVVLDVNSLRFSESPVYVDVPHGIADSFQESLMKRLRSLYAMRAKLKRKEVKVNRLSVQDWRNFDFLSSPGVMAFNSRKDVQPPDPTVQWDGAQDLSAKVLLGWDDANFYFFASVTDDNHCTPRSGKDIYMNDAIQMGFDTLDNAKKTGGYQKDDFEFGMSAGCPFWVWQGAESGAFKGVGASVVRSGTTTEYRAAIPWSRLRLSSVPESMGFAFVIQDNDDGSKARYRIAFGGGIAEGKRPGKFHRLMFAPAP